MEQKFDFDSIGKKMPYTVPDALFSEIESNVLKALEPERRRKAFRRVLSRAVYAAVGSAACVAVLIAVRPPSSGDALGEIDNAYACLSEADQQYLLDVYQEDVFINQEYDEQ